MLFLLTFSDKRLLKTYKGEKNEMYHRTKKLKQALPPMWEDQKKMFDIE